MTPMLQQYLKLKEQYPGCVLFFRLGDFYEMFFEDAKVAAPILDIALTTRNREEPDPVPMCGVPYHSVTPYLQKLLAQGYKVAICEQVEDPKEAKGGIIRRDVVRVLTPGLALDPVDSKSHQWLVSLYPGQSDRFSLARLDLSTGEISVTTGSENEVKDEMERLSPAECLIPEDVNWEMDRLITKRPRADFEMPVEERHPLPAISEFSHCALRALTRYLEVNKFFDLQHLKPVSTYALHSYLYLDATAVRGLELLVTMMDQSKKGSLLWVLDRTVTSMGGRLLKQWLLYPWRDVAPILSRQQAVAYFVHGAKQASHLTELLQGISDVERLLGRISLGVANPRDLAQLRDSLVKFPEVDRLLDQSLSLWGEKCDPCDDLVQTLSQSLVDAPPVATKDGGIIRDGYCPELDELLRISRDFRRLLAELETREKEKTGISSLKVRFNRVFGYYLEVTRANLSKVPESYKRKQTLSTGERFYTEELRELEDKILHAEERRLILEEKIFSDLCDQVKKALPRLQKVAERLAMADVVVSLATVARENDWVAPEIDNSLGIEIIEGRHPIIEKIEGRQSFVSNDVSLNSEQQQVLMITGPNMAGKSTVMRQTAAIVILAQMGSFVPAKRAKIGIVDRIFTRIGASDRLHLGESTFMVEMREVATILKEATPRSLIILDEVGRGTSTYDGISLAWAIIEEIHDRVGARTLFSTHYHELAELVKRPRIMNYHVAVQEWQGKIVFLRKLMAGVTSQSYGIEVAKLAGVPLNVIVRGSQILAKLVQIKKRGDSASDPQLSLFS